MKATHIYISLLILLLSGCDRNMTVDTHTAHLWTFFLSILIVVSDMIISMKKLFLLIGLVILLSSCAPHRTGDDGTTVTKGSTCWTKGYAMNTVYEVKHLSNKKYKGYGACMGMFSTKHEHIKNEFKKSGKI